MRSNPHSKDGATILIVDDTPDNLDVLGELLEPYYRVLIANHGERALRLAKTTPHPDLILLDVMMPGMDGFEVLQHLRADPGTAGIPVILVTALDGSADEERGLRHGAVDYVTKPFAPSVVMARVRVHLELKRARDRLSQAHGWLEAAVEQRVRENLMVQDLNVRALACLAEARDNETGRHIVRTRAFVEVLAHHLQSHPRFAHALQGQGLAMTVKAAPLHDIGKVGIPDAVLLKPGALTAEEFALMKTHPLIGAQSLERAMLQSSSGEFQELVRQHPEAFSFMQVARDIVLSHHERWDGSGYPQGLKGDAIPVAARLMALADVYDALSTRRVYKQALSHAQSREMVIQGRGTHFDPDVVDAFVEHQSTFAKIARRFADDADTPSSAEAVLRAAGSGT